MKSRHWIRSGNMWRPSVVNDTPPNGLNELDDKIKEICELAKRHGATIFVGKVKLMPVNCVYNLLPPPPPSNQNKSEKK